MASRFWLRNSYLRDMVGKTAWALGATEVGVTKAEFVRANPDVGPKELVALAAEQGIVFTAGYVSQIRYQDSKKAQRFLLSVDSDGAPKRKRVTKPKPEKQAVEAIPMVSDDVAAEFRRLVTRIGTDRARSILEDLEA